MRVENANSGFLCRHARLLNDFGQPIAIADGKTGEDADLALRNLIMEALASHLELGRCEMLNHVYKPLDKVRKDNDNTTEERSRASV